MPKRDRYTTIEDFLSDESFHQWVRSKANHSDWDEWVAASPERSRLVEEARIWLLAMKVDETPLSDSEVQAGLNETWVKIAEAERKQSFWRLGWLRIAAMIFLLCTIGVIYYMFRVESKSVSTTYAELTGQEIGDLIEQTNYTNKPKLITLSDASSVLLQPESKLIYPKEFNGGARKVYLSGEGFFEISKDTERPFYVYSGEVVTKVFGTSFRVIAYSDQPNIEVLVKTGKVKVTPSERSNVLDRKELMLTPNQAVRFTRTNLSFEKIKDITQDKQLAASINAIEQLNFEFRDIPVSQIFTIMEQAYSIHIEYPKPVLKECYMTTSLSDEPLPEKLKIICESLGNDTHYKINDNTITIMTTGCN